MMNIAKITIEKSTMTPMKSPIAKFIPFPIGILIMAFLYSPPGKNALGIGMIMSATNAETTLLT